MIKSNCKPGQELYNPYYSEILNKDLLQYEYCSLKGKLFSCLARNLEHAREKKDLWLKKQN
jgi:hypothetical protein